MMIFNIYVENPNKRVLFR